MIFAARKNSILFLQRRGFVLYGGGKTSGESFEFSEKAVSKEEVIDQGELREQIKKFLIEKKVVAAHLIIVLSQQVLFGRKITTPDPVAQQEEIKLFLEEIPFEHISKRIFKIDNAVNVVATNRDLYEKIAICFKDLGWSLDAVVPVVLFGKIGIDNLLNSDDILYINKRLDLVRIGNFLGAGQSIYREPALADSTHTNTNRTGTFTKRKVVIGAIIVLVLLLGAVFYLMFAKTVGF